MDYFLKQYKQMCKQEFGQYGFKTYCNNHYRIVNDIFQSFCLHRSIYGHDATIEFCIRSLAEEDTIDKTASGANHLKRFENSEAWFPYDKRDEKSIDYCIESMLSYMKRYLIPFFLNATTSEYAYKEICEFEKKATHNSVSIQN